MLMNKNKEKSKKRKPPILCLTLLTLMITARPSIVSAQSTENVYGIEPEASYPGSLVIEILTAAEEEASIAIGEAYAEGYKAGLFEAAPEAAYWQAAAAQNQKTEKKKTVPWWATVLSFFLGGISGGISSWAITR
jgi:hypothetical protein